MKPFPYHRILIVGCSGSGKSTLALEMGKLFNLPVIHLDKLLWLPNWQTRSEQEFDALLMVELNKKEWIIDGNFNRTFETRLKYADLCIFLDYDTEVCIQGVYDRVKKYNGVTRPDMGEGCIERYDEEFIDYIKVYKEKSRPKMIKKLKNSSTPYIMFKTREETASWLNEFTKAI